jgi:hypothetical protein
LGGDSFKVTLDATKPTVGEAKSEIARVQGTTETCQELYKVAERADGLAVREDDAEPELLDEESMVLGDGDMVTMAVKEEAPLLWRTFAADRVTLSEDGAVAAKMYLRSRRSQQGKLDALVTSEVELTEGRHYWEVVSVSGWVHVGVTRPNLDPTGDYTSRDCIDGWFMATKNGALYGNGKYSSDSRAYSSRSGDRFGVLLDLNDGSILFFKNGVQHGPGYPAGSVVGPVVHAVQFSIPVRFASSESIVRLLRDAAWPTGHAQ